MTKADTILQSIKEYLDGGKKASALPREKWEDAGLALNIYLGEEEDLLGTLEQRVAEEKIQIFDKQEKRNVAEADTILEATDLHRQMRNQKRKCDRIKEFIKLCKLRAKGEQY